MTRSGTLAAAVGALLLLPAPPAALAASERQSLEELRNTVVNLLQALVEKGVMSREKAADLVRDAQDKATADAEAAAKADEGAVRVPYVPQIVRDEISRQVASEVRTAVVDDVVARARQERWGVPAAMPDWLSRIHWSGDVRVRAQADLFAAGNIPGVYLDFLTVDDRGGIGRAGPAAFTNVEQDRYRGRVQARLGLDATLGGGFTAGVRLVTGNLRDPDSNNQTLGQYAGKLNFGVDQAYIRWNGGSDGGIGYTVQTGRFQNPWLSTDLIFDNDLSFDGLAASVRVPFGSSPRAPALFVTAGAHPLTEVELSGADKWLYAGQIGADLQFAERHRLRIAAAWYDFRNVQGRRNLPDSVLLDYTAPAFLQRGNTLFDIRNDTDVATNLFALAGKYRLANVTLDYQVPVWRGLDLGIVGDYVRNVGWKSDDVRAVSGIVADRRVDGYQAEVWLGRSDPRNGGWRTSFTYRYVQRDAVLDAFTDSDFRLGGTDAKGYGIAFEYGLRRGTWLRLRYLTGDEIDGAPFGVDVVQLDLNAQF